MTKFFQDPVYGQVAVSSPLLLKLIDTRAVQRLKHIRQLGTSFFTFLGADHSRFSHSLGCMRLMDEVLKHLQSEGLRLKPAERELAVAAALLHDVGHCAFSHTLESVLGHSHERMGARLAREEPQLRSLLGGRRSQVAELLEGRGRGVVQELISSQLDVDRLDYLVRDAHYTGVNSGKVDLSRIVAALTARAGRLLVKEKALLAVEEYFLARYFMYWKVYFHKTSRGLELVLQGLVRRARGLLARGELAPDGITPALRAVMTQGPEVGVAEFLDHDDSDVMVAIKRWQYGRDPVLRDLSRRFLNRDKFKLVWEARTIAEEPPPRLRERIRERFEERGRGFSEYYFIEDRIGNLPYDPAAPVWILRESGKTEDLARRSQAIREVARPLVRARYYVPAQDAAWVSRMLEGA